MRRRQWSHNSSQSAFQTALDGSFTLVNLDAGALDGLPNSYRVEDAGPAALFLGLGIDFFNYNAEVRTGQDGQIATPGRDRLILNGTGFGGVIGINFTIGVNGVGALSNNIDGGRVQIYSGANFGGAFLGEKQFGPGALFGGLTSDIQILSARFTCGFNADLRCGVYDIQFGTFTQEEEGIPAPANAAIVLVGLAAIAARRRLTAT